MNVTVIISSVHVIELVVAADTGDGGKGLMGDGGDERHHYGGSPCYGGGGLHCGGRSAGCSCNGHCHHCTVCCMTGCGGRRHWWWHVDIVHVDGGRCGRIGTGHIPCIVMLV